MKKFIPHWCRILTLSISLLLLSRSAFASHIVGMDLNYAWDSGNTYKITLVAYANCSSVDSSTAYASLPTAHPVICIYNGGTSVTSITLNLESLDSGKEITPVCPSDSLNTQCHNLASLIPGIREYLYTGYYTVP